MNRIDVLILPGYGRCDPMSIIRDPQQSWPLYPVLAMRTREVGPSGWPRLGVIACFDPRANVALTVYLGTLGIEITKLDDLLVSDFPKEEFPDFRSLLEVWQID